MNEKTARTIIAILAHNEERAIGACLESLSTNMTGISTHVIVNGSSDRTADVARQFQSDSLTVHEWERGGKSRSWNRFLFDTLGIDADYFIFVDGDAVIAPGSIEALVAALQNNPEANAASALPRNGRNFEFYRAEIIRTHGLFGDLYALSGRFIENMKANNIRLPDDLIGDDGLVGAFAKTNLGDHEWRDALVIPVPAAGFFCGPVKLYSPAGLLLQARRMVNYSVRHFQNRIISSIMDETGPRGLPRHLASLYSQWLKQFQPRASLTWWWFDRKALARMRDQSRIHGE